MRRQSDFKPYPFGVNKLTPKPAIKLVRKIAKHQNADKAKICVLADRPRSLNKILELIANGS